jgi:hypothetical protein
VGHGSGTPSAGGSAGADWPAAGHAGGELLGFDWALVLRQQAEQLAGPEVRLDLALTIRLEEVRHYQLEHDSIL